MTERTQAINDHELPQDLPKFGTRTIAAVAVVVVIVFAILFVTGFIPHRNRVGEADRIAAEQETRPLVDIIQARQAASAIDVILPGDARALQQTLIFPRANGYLKKLHVDIGDRVKDGQLLAEIDAPELDAQLNEAKATLEQVKTTVTKAQSDYDLSLTTVKRYEESAKSGAVVQQDLDEKRAAAKQAQSALESARANVVASQAGVQRLTEMQGFEKVTAPFAGVISARNFDIGALLNPANTDAGQQLFSLDQTSTIRVFINVPQTYATSLKTGEPAEFVVANYPGRVFKGKVTRSAGSLDPTTRTMRFQIEIDNADFTLAGGMYGQVKLHVAQEKPPLLIPASAMIFDTAGTMVAVVNDNKAHFQNVTLGRDLGTELEVLEGLTGKEAIIANPGQRLVEGIEVKVVEKPTTAPAK